MPKSVILSYFLFRIPEDVDTDKLFLCACHFACCENLARRGKHVPQLPTRNLPGPCPEHHWNEFGSFELSSPNCDVRGVSRGSSAAPCVCPSLNTSASSTGICGPSTKPSDGAATFDFGFSEDFVDDVVAANAKNSQRRYTVM